MVKEDPVNRRIAVALACLLAIAAAWMACGPGGDGPPGPKNVILVTLDTLRPDHLGCYGHPTVQTPHLDALAGRSVRFTQAVTVVPTTLASHLSILTGTSPRTHGVPRNGFRAHEDNETLAEILKAHGYTTAAFVSAFSLDAQFNLTQGFDHYDCTYDEGLRWDMVRQAERRAEATTDAVLAWLGDRARAPFLLWVHYFDPHFPYDPPGRYVDLYDPDYRGTADGSMGYLEEVWEKRVFPSAEDRRHVIALYDGEVSYLDEHVGRLLDALDETRLAERSVVVVVADHGESLGEHEYDFDHGMYVYDASIRVPLLVRDPSVAGGRVVDEQVQTLDLAPTILDLVGLPIPERMEGRSLAPLMRGRTPDAEPVVFSEASKPWNVEGESETVFRNEWKAKCARTDGWKFIYTPFAERWELYDLARDPGETLNLYGSEPARAEQMRRMLQAWATRPRSRLPTLDFTTDPETLERLRSLGYIQ